MNTIYRKTTTPKLKAATMIIALFISRFDIESKGGDTFSRNVDGLQLRRASSIQADGKRVT